MSGLALPDLSNNAEIVEFYCRARQIYSDSSKHDCDRRTEIYNICIAQWSKLLPKKRDTEPSIDQFHKDGSWRQSQIEEHFQPRASTVSAFGSRIIKKRKHRK